MVPAVRLEVVELDVLDAALCSLHHSLCSRPCGRVVVWSPRASFALLILTRAATRQKRSPFCLLNSPSHAAPPGGGHRAATCCRGTRGARRVPQTPRAASRADALAAFKKVQIKLFIDSFLQHKSDIAPQHPGMNFPAFTLPAWVFKHSTPKTEKLVESKYCVGMAAAPRNTPYAQAPSARTTSGA